ncbi:MAG: type III-B CRISPR-associated protein Cas10/Cmr2 [Chitinophagales bacterium]
MTNTRIYIGITIGPIVQTIGMARSTKELWAASYLFSYLMRNLIKELGISHPEKFITPYIGADEATEIGSDIFDKHFGAGVFPDRMIVDVTGTEYEDFEEVEAMIERVKEQIIQEIVVYFTMIVTNKFLTEERIELYLAGFGGYESFLKRYFKIYAVQKEMDIAANSAVAAEIFPLLEAIENQASIISWEKTVRVEEGKKALPNFLEFYLSNIHIISKGDYTHHQTLYQKVFGGQKAKGAYGHLKIDPDSSSYLNRPKEGFPSIQDIATIGLREDFEEEYEHALSEATKQEKKEEKETLAKLKGKDKKRKVKVADYFYPELQKTFNVGKTAANKKLKQYHKYICIVHADGDNVGKAIKQIGGDLGKYRLFSKALSGFAKDAARLVDEFSGKPIYVGGDDLVFFAPIRAKRGNIFELVEVLSDRFDQAIGDFMRENNMTFNVTPTLSFGVSMTYHKFPLFEAVELSREHLLDELAKGFEGRKGKKNALAFRVSKHSTSYFEAVLYKDKTTPQQQSAKPKTSYEFFMQMVTQDQIAIDQLSSLSYKLRNNKALLYEIAYEPMRIDAFFRNFFNEAIHKASGGQSYIDLVKGLLKVLFAENLPDKCEVLSPECLTKKENANNLLTGNEKIGVETTEEREKRVKRQKQLIKQATIKTVDSCIKTLYGILRMINFLNQNASNEDE